MPTTIGIKKGYDKEIITLSALLGVTGIGIIVLGLRGAAATMGGIRGVTVTELESGPKQVSLGDVIQIVAPKALWQGPDRDLFTYLDIRQKQPNGDWASVYGSGVAGLHVPACPQAAWVNLVAPDQPEPPDCAAQGLCAYPYPGRIDPNTGSIPTPICGAPAQVGPATARLLIFTDGFAAPTCNNRKPIYLKEWANVINFVP